MAKISSNVTIKNHNKFIFYGKGLNEERKVNYSYGSHFEP